jgi:PAS domain S-box-containing protein
MKGTSRVGRASREALESQVRAGAAELLQARESFRVLVENLPDVVARFDRELRHLFVSPAVERISGRSARDFLGRTNRELGMPSELVETWDAALRKVFVSGQAESIEFSFPSSAGMRYFDCRLVAEAGADGTIQSVLSVAREVTEQRLALVAAQRARAIADALREATIVLTRSLDRETVLVTLLDRLRRIVPFDRASIMLVEDPARVSVRAVHDGVRVVALPRGERWELDPAEHPLIAGILRSGATMRISDIRAHPGWHLPLEQPVADGGVVDSGVVADPGAASWLGVPLFARGDVAGLFLLGKRETGYFDDDHVKLAEAMSSQASVAVENAVLFAQMQASTQRLQSLSRRLVEAQESERRNIARELHDEAGQALASLRYGLRLLEREVGSGDSVTERVAELMHQTDAVIDGLHRLAADLRPASLDHLGLDAALRQYTRAAAAKFGLTVHFGARGFSSERLPAVVETALYRVVQEAMTNAVRHARATRVDVLAERRGERVMVMVEDNGVGFEAEHIQRGEHIGLLGMRERAEALGGTLTVESAPGAGTTVVVEVASVDPHPDR